MKISIFSESMKKKILFSGSKGWRRIGPWLHKECSDAHETPLQHITDSFYPLVKQEICIKKKKSIFRNAAHYKVVISSLRQMTTIII